MNTKNAIQDSQKPTNMTAKYYAVTPEMAKMLLLEGGGLEWLKKSGNARRIMNIVTRLRRNDLNEADLLVSIDENKRILKGHEHLFAVFETRTSCVMKIECVAA